MTHKNSRGKERGVYPNNSANCSQCDMNWSISTCQVQLTIMQCSGHLKVPTTYNSIHCKIKRQWYRFPMSARPMQLARGATGIAFPSQRFSWKSSNWFNATNRAKRKMVQGIALLTEQETQCCRASALKVSKKPLLQNSTFQSFPEIFEKQNVYNSKISNLHGTSSFCFPTTFLALRSSPCIRRCWRLCTEMTLMVQNLRIFYIPQSNSNKPGTSRVNN